MEEGGETGETYVERIQAVLESLEGRRTEGLGGGQGLIRTGLGPRHRPLGPSALKDDEDRVNVGLEPLPRPNSHFALPSSFPIQAPSAPFNRPPRLPGPPGPLRPSARYNNGGPHRGYRSSMYFGPPLPFNPSLDEVLGRDTLSGEEVSGEALVMQSSDSLSRLLCTRLPPKSLLLVSPAAFLKPEGATLDELGQPLRDILAPGTKVLFDAVQAADGVFSVLSLDMAPEAREPKVREREALVTGRLGETGPWVCASNGTLTSVLILPESVWDEASAMAALAGGPRDSREPAWLEKGARVTVTSLRLPRELREGFAVRKGSGVMEELALSVVEGRPPPPSPVRPLSPISAAPPKAKAEPQPSQPPCPSPSPSSAAKRGSSDRSSEPRPKTKATPAVRATALSESFSSLPGGWVRPTSPALSGASVSLALERMMAEQLDSLASSSSAAPSVRASPVPSLASSIPSASNLSLYSPKPSPKPSADPVPKPPTAEAKAPEPARPPSIILPPHLLDQSPN